MKNNILIAVDFDEHSEALIQKVVASFSSNIKKVWLLHAAAPDPDFVGYEAGPQSVRDQRAKELKKEHKTLELYTEDLEDKGYEAEGLLVQGPTIKTILEEADKLSIDIIAVGNHDYSFFYKLFFSTSSDLIHSSDIPVFVVPL